MILIAVNMQILNDVFQKLKFSALMRLWHAATRSCASTLLQKDLSAASSRLFVMHPHHCHNGREVVGLREPSRDISTRAAADLRWEEIRHEQPRR